MCQNRGGKKHKSKRAQPAQIKKSTNQNRAARSTSRKERKRCPRPSPAPHRCHVRTSEPRRSRGLAKADAGPLRGDGAELGNQKGSVSAFLARFSHSSCSGGDGDSYSVSWLCVGESRCSLCSFALFFLGGGGGVVTWFCGSYLVSLHCVGVSLYSLHHAGVLLVSRHFLILVYLKS